MAASTPSAYLAMQPNSQGRIDYSNDENRVWRDLMARQRDLFAGRACDEYMHGLASLDLPTDHVPQLSDIDQVLNQATGWKTAAVPALIPFQRFFELLASKQFPVATFIRRREDFDYLQEPDIFHEIVGHCPLLTHPDFAYFTEQYGKLGLAASAKQRVYLARLYWFTVEFGLLKSAKKTQIYGGGILSSPGETLYCLGEQAKRLSFDLDRVLRTPYRIDIMQPLYFEIESFAQLFEIANMDIMQAVRDAMQKPLFDALYPTKNTIEN
ncbi:phenylalanine 4-monooxygenase [Alginatibacterium sediminis]|uniref:Phenylalanine-4-hydroxylase n=1 Tax=Alginatibacterium sediminis TaxID=2164068 RepID=A0A420EHR2_9ALTE|nr:phenylalanine 4-monooxygenase [Alginatibacterium sediminis]RKF20239.1 phenylalanine 4-monooxygenase [Alginatibacterium sediminis]